MPIKELPIGYLEYICKWTLALQLTTSLLCSHTQTAMKLCHSLQDVFLWENLEGDPRHKRQAWAGDTIEAVHTCLTTVRTWAWGSESVPRIHKEKAERGWKLETTEVWWEREAEAGPSLEAPWPASLVSWQSSRPKADPVLKNKKVEGT